MVDGEAFPIVKSANLAKRQECHAELLQVPIYEQSGFGKRNSDTILSLIGSGGEQPPEVTGKVW